MCPFVYTHTVANAPQHSEEGLRSLRASVTGGCEPRCCEVNSIPLDEQCILLTSELPPQPLSFAFAFETGLYYVPMLSWYFCVAWAGSNSGAA